MPLFNTVNGYVMPKATNGDELVKALTIDRSVSPASITYNGDTLYISPYTEVTNYEAILTSIESEYSIE